MIAMRIRSHAGVDSYPPHASEDIDSALQQDSTHIWAVCGIVGSFGIALLIAVASMKERAPLKDVLLTAGEHVGSAFIVAALMGLTYEFYIHRLRSASDRRELAKAISQVSVTLPITVFELLAEIAVRIPYTPTLYLPERRDQAEIALLHNYSILQSLLDSAANREEEEKIFKEWFEVESHRRLKFLGSDIVGLLKRRSIATRLGQQADLYLRHWEDVEDADKGWVLNYKWAASRCDDPMYSSLIEFLLKTEHTDIHQWILFVPQQMPHPTLGGMVTQFLKEKGATASAETLKIALDSMVQIHLRTHVAQTKAFRRHGGLFMKAGLVTEYSAARALMEQRRRSRRKKKLDAGHASEDERIRATVREFDDRVPR